MALLQIAEPGESTERLPVPYALPIQDGYLRVSRTEIRRS
jgi:hypothetical protein